MQGLLSSKLYLPCWSLESSFSREDLVLERVSRDLLRNDSQIANQGRAMTMQMQMQTQSYGSTQKF